MKLFTSKNLSSSISIILHAIVFILFLLYFNQKAETNNKQQYVELGFGGTTESNSPGTPRGGIDEVKAPQQKEKTKVKEKKKPKHKAESISEKDKKEKKVKKNTASSDTSKGSSPDKMKAGNTTGSGGGTGSGGDTGSGGSGSGNGQPGSGPPKKGLYIPNDIYFVAVDQMPVPIGGTEAINARVFYPPAAKANKIQGTVYVLAFIDERGYVKKVSLIKGIGYGCDQAAERAVKDTRFEPGAMHGIPVKVQMTIPIKFGTNN